MKTELRTGLERQQGMALPAQGIPRHRVPWNQLPQAKLTAAFTSSDPLERATCGYGQSGIVRSTTEPGLCKAGIDPGALPCSTQSTMAESI